jgi:hypothetical protein
MIPLIFTNSFFAIISLAMLSSMLVAVPTNALFLPGLHTIRGVVHARHAAHARAVVARDDLVSVENYYKRASNKKCNSTSQKLSVKPSSNKKPSSTTSSHSKTTTSSKSTPTSSHSSSSGSGGSAQVSSYQPASSGRKAGLAWALGNTPSVRNFMLPKVS